MPTNVLSFNIQKLNNYRIPLLEMINAGVDVPLKIAFDLGKNAATKKPQSSNFDPQMLPGVGAKLAREMTADGIDSAEKLRALGVDGLKKYKGVGGLKAGLIMEAVSKK